MTLFDTPINVKCNILEKKNINLKQTRPNYAEMF